MFELFERKREQVGERNSKRYESGSKYGEEGVPELAIPKCHTR
jgi:hypothetical protein